MSRFFINRPIFASVISIIIVIAGLVASRVLPIAQYPEIAPPTVLITAAYPGASADTIAKTVAAPIEEQLNGVEGLSYFTSSAAANGVLTITATFGTSKTFGWLELGGSTLDKLVVGFISVKLCFPPSRAINARRSNA